MNVLGVALAAEALMGWVAVRLVETGALVAHLVETGALAGHLAVIARQDALAINILVADHLAV